MLTVFAVIGVLFTIAFIAFSFDNAKNNQTTTYPKSPQTLMRDSPQIKIRAHIISKAVEAIQNDNEIRRLIGIQRKNRIAYKLTETEKLFHFGLIPLAENFNLPPIEVLEHISWSFQELRKEYRLV